MHRSGDWFAALAAGDFVRLLETLWNAPTSKKSRRATCQGHLVLDTLASLSGYRANSEGGGIFQQQGGGQLATPIR